MANSPPYMNMNGSKSQHSSPRKMSAPSPPSRPQWTNGSPLGSSGGGSMRGPRNTANSGHYATQVQQQKHFHQQVIASQNNYPKGPSSMSNGGKQLPSASKV